MKTSKKPVTTSGLLLILILIPCLQSCFLDPEIEIEKTFYSVAIENNSSVDFNFFYQRVTDDTVTRIRFVNGRNFASLTGIVKPGDQGLLADTNEFKDQFLVFRAEAFIDGQMVVKELDLESGLDSPEETDFNVDSFFNKGDKGYSYTFSITDEILKE